MSIDPISDSPGTGIGTLDDSLQTLQNNNTDETGTAQNGALTALASTADQPGSSDAAVVSLSADGSQDASQQAQTYGRAHGRGGHHHGGHHHGGAAGAAQNGQSASSSVSTAGAPSADDDISAQLGATEQIAD